MRDGLQSDDLRMILRRERTLCLCRTQQAMVLWRAWASSIPSDTSLRMIEGRRTTTPSSVSRAKQSPMSPREKVAPTTQPMMRPDLTEASRALARGAHVFFLS